MESKLAQQARLELIAATQQMTPEERLKAFAEHCQNVMALYEAGERLRQAQQPAIVRATASGQSTALLLDVVDQLAQEKIDYAVVGAMAAAVHGVIRATADAVLLLSVQEAAALHKKLVGAGFQAQLQRGDFMDPIQATLTVDDPFRNRVDLLIGLRGLESAAFGRALVVPFNGASLRIIGREDFVAMKAFAGGPQDLRDAEAALVAAGAGIDLPLLRRLTARYGRDAVQALEKLLAHPSP